MLYSLNCLRHSISYDEVNNFETSFSELNVKNRVINRLYQPCPDLIVCHIFWDSGHYLSTILGRFSQGNENLSSIVETLFVLFCFTTIYSVYISHKSYSKIKIELDSISKFICKRKLTKKFLSAIWPLEEQNWRKKLIFLDWWWVVTLFFPSTRPAALNLPRKDTYHSVPKTVSALRFIIKCR